MKNYKFFLLLILLFNQNSQANIFSTMSSTFFDYVNEHKTLSAFASGVALGALSIGCVWYYTNLRTNHQPPYKTKEKKRGAVSSPLEIPCFFYEDNCIQEHAKRLFINFLGEHSDFARKYVLKCTNLEDYINNEYRSNKSPLVFIRGDGRPSDCVNVLNEKILNVNPLYVAMEPAMTQSNYDAIKTTCEGDLYFVLAYKQSWSSSSCNVEVPNDEKNRESRTRIVKKFQELYGK